MKFVLNIYFCIKKMANNNYEQMTVTSLKNLARERGKTGYSKLNKSELI